jgi:hypothetical protein
MRRGTQRTANRLALQSFEMAFAVPQVIAQRTARMLAAGTAPSVKDQREFLLMSSEKAEAFVEAWLAVTMRMFTGNQQLALSMLRLWWMPWTGSPLSTSWSAPQLRALRSAQGQLQDAGLGVMALALAPVHKRAIANAKRLSRRKR